MKHINFILFVALTLILLVSHDDIQALSIPAPAADQNCPSWAYSDSLGGHAKSEPSIQHWNGRYIIAAQGTEDSVWVKEWNGQDLADWYVVNGGMTSGRLKLAVEGGSLWMYAIGRNDDSIYRTKYLSQGQWSEWENLNLPASNFGNAGPTISNGHKIYQAWPNNSDPVKIGECIASYSPDLTKDLIIYQVMTKEHTSPNGPQTGTFNSLKEKLPYMQQLGITGLWVNGFSWSHPFFYNNFFHYSPLPYYWSRIK